MKKVYVCVGTLVLTVILIVSLAVTIHGGKRQEEMWKNEVENVKAYEKLLDSSEGRNGVFKLTIDQLKHSNDSIFKKLDEARRELGIKDSKLKALQYVSSDFSRVDTIVLRDSVFRDATADIDTLLHDDWYTMEIGLRYPSTIIARPRFRSEKHIVVSTRRETVNPPKRFFLFRWFQKKHTVLNVDVVEKNPYVQNQSGRFVEIVRQ